MTGRVGRLGAEGGAEGVDVAEGHGEDLGVELAGHRQRHGLAEEVLAEIGLALIRQRAGVGIDGGDAEHLARALGVAAGDQRGVHVQVALVVEEAVDGLGRHGAHPEGALEQVGPGPEVLDGAQVLQRVALLLERVVRWALAHHGDLLRLQLEGLLVLGGDDQRALGLDGRAGGDALDDVGIVRQPVCL